MGIRVQLKEPFVLWKYSWKKRRWKLKINYCGKTWSSGWMYTCHEGESREKQGKWWRISQLSCKALLVGRLLSAINSSLPKIESYLKLEISTSSFLFNKLIQTENNQNTASRTARIISNDYQASKKKEDYDNHRETTWVRRRHLFPSRWGARLRPDISLSGNIQIG